MKLDLTDRVVVVTGAGRGIGRVIAERFLAESAYVVALDLDAGRLDWLGGSDPVRAVGLAADVSDSAAVAGVVEQVKDRFGRIDVLVNNAGILVEGLVEELSDEAWDRSFAVNVGGTFKTCRAVIPIMKAQRSGRILNAASFAAIVPSVGTAAYAAAKSAVAQFSRTLAGELGPWNITVNAYAPGMIPTAMNGFADMDPAAQNRLLDTLTLRRWGRAEEVADLLCFLASDAAAYITGTLVDVSGGKLATQLPQVAHQRAAEG
jgi:3-oxoacyl-[acyl-carrier protein] reductase